MRTVDEWLARYDESHRHPVNKAVHWFCVPLIVVSLLGLLWWIPAVLVVVAATVWYVRLSVRLAFGMAAGSALILGGLALYVGRVDLPLWKASLAAFAIGWIAQFVGHAIEGKRPSFAEDLQFLLIGPLWVLGALYRRLGLRY